MQVKKPLRVIIDTNLWISFIISKKLTVLDAFLFSNKITLLFSTELLDEINLTITKPKLKKFFKGKALDLMLSRLEPFIELIEISSSINICRDPNDNFLLELAKDGQADYLLTGDNDLLDLHKFELTKIMTIISFFDELENEE